MTTLNLRLDQPVYTVATPIYEGPLDLLLQLIERDELDITKVSLARVTNPFLDYVRQLEKHQADQVSIFLTVAARLMQIKSEALLPRPVEREPGEEDPGEELIRQLLAYKRYKEIASILEERESIGLRTFVRLAPPPKGDPQLDLSGMTVDDLTLAAFAVYTALARIQPINNIVRAPRVTLRDKIGQIVEKLQVGQKTTFKKLVGKHPNRLDVVVTFLAMLELIKQFRIRATQEKLFSEIEIEPEESFSPSVDFELDIID
jgi:segregation and condensation protein A